MPDDNQEGNAQMSARGAELRLGQVSSHTTKELTMTHQRHPNDPPPAGDELLTISEVAAIVRAPIATMRYWRHLGTGPRSFRLGRRVVYRVGDLRAWIDAQADASDAGAAASEQG
jgi:predicted DNA-binding transcriptional regulator AlpA